MSSNSKLTAALSTQEKRALLAGALRKRTAAPKSYPVSFAQRRLWFLDQLEPNSPLYNITTAVRLSGRLDVDALRQALGEMVRRHESLRTTFALADGSPVQVVSPVLQLPVPLTNLSALPEAAREDETARLARAEAETPFDLGAGPLLRAGLLRLGEREHVMLLTMHHIVSDGWSMGVLVRELTTLYKAFSEGAPLPLPELPIQYADYAQWQHRWLTGEVLESQLDYWKRQLSAAPVLQLPTDRPRRPVRSTRGARHAFNLPRALAEAVRALGTAHNATPFMTLLAAFASLLQRYTQQEEIVVGCPIAGRNRKETEGLIGFFVNTLVLRVEVGGDPTFGELLARVRETALGAYAHQDLPFEMLVERLQPERRLSHTPLFQVAFVMQSGGESHVELDGLTFSRVQVENNFAKFDLTLAVEETGRGLRAVFEYSTELFDAETVERMAGHLRTLLEGAVGDPGRRLSELPLLTEAERLRLPSVRAGRAAARRPAKCLPELFAEQARRTPDAVAVIYEGTRLTYAELDARANRLARRLRALGVGPDVLVGVYLERSAEMIVALLGVLKAGGAYLPLDPAYPRERLAFMLEDAAAPVLLTETTLADTLPQYGGHILRLDAGAGADDDESTPPSCDAAPDNLAYVIYTSGSTGRPKGVLVTHRNVTRLFDAVREQFDFDESDTWTLFHSYAFDFSVWELWGALLYGGRLVVVPYMTSRTPELFYELLKEQRVTVLNQTPSAFRQLSRVMESAGRPQELALRVVVFGGEALELQSLRAWVGLFGDEQPQLVNMYGITETTVHVTYRRVRAAEIEGGAGSVIGDAISDLELYVLDRRMQHVPVGVVGEMYVGGEGVARGYLKRPGLTAERFVPHPFTAQAGARLYRTGDLARHLSGGDIEYVGRADNQVKVRGFRIELGEIEAALLEHPAIAEAVVTARQDSSGHKSLAAYVVARPGEEPPTAELRAWLSTRLPDYMVPQAFVTLERVPLTPSGKVNHRQLPAPERSADGREYVAPGTHEEELLAAAWAETLGVERVGVTDNFFELGGDSIRSIQLVAGARRRGVELSVQQLFQHQTVRELARVVAPTRAAAEATKDGPFSLISEGDRARLPEGVEDAYPLALLQAGMLFHGEYDPADNLYHNVSSAHIRAPFNESKLRAALEQLAARHEVLRTSFDLSDYGEPLQLVHGEARVPLEVEDLRRLTPEEQAAHIATAVEAEKGRKFDWRHAPLLRFHVHLRDAETFQLTWAEHHAILDGWSVALMLTELFQLYSAGAREGSGAPPPPRVRFRDFVALERAALGSEEARRYWEERLSDSVVTTLPRRRTGPRAAGRDSVTTSVSGELFEGLKRLAHEAGVPLKHVLLAAHLRVLSVFGGRTDVVTGVVANGRPEEEGGDRTLGLFLNTLPFRLRLRGGTWRGLVRETFEAEREMLPFRRYPLARLQEARGNRPLFEAAFNYVHFHVYGNLRAAAQMEVLGETSFAETNFTFSASFSLDHASSRVLMSLDYDASEFEREQIEAACGYYVRALEAMSREPSGRYELCSLVDERERGLLSDDWNDTRRDYGPPACLHYLFERQARRTPEALAVVCEGEALSYVELNRRADVIARRLRLLGVGVESRVAVLLRRSPSLVTALLGVLKAGGAYVPLDSSYPRERLSFMLEDCGAGVLVTERALRDLLPQHSASLLCLDDLSVEDEGAESQTTAPPVLPESLAYVIYTSGSTGKPKGVMVSHRAICNQMRWMQDEFGFDESDRVLQKTPLSFDASVWEFYAPLLSGGQLVLARPDGHRDPAYLTELMASAGVTVAQMVPSLWRALVGEPGLGSCHALRLAFSGGEALAASLAERIKEAPGAGVYNLYGPTEVTINAMCGEWSGGAGEWASIGRPVANTRAYVLGPWMNLTPSGTAGELYLGGAQVARGYLNRPGLTAERFVPDPFSGEPGARLYRTGDVVKHLPDGRLEYLGRADHQLKVRGFRIEPGEIEAALDRLPSVRAAAVVLREDLAGEQQLVAYLAAEEGATLPRAELRRLLRETLPEHMVPASFVSLEKLPLTANGKLDRLALPAPESARQEACATCVAPRDRVELKLRHAWEEVLGVRPIGVTENFFELGGHSLLALRLVSRVEKYFGRKLSLADFYRAATIEGMAGLLRGWHGRGRNSALVEIQPSGAGSPLFCVHPASGSALSFVWLAGRLGQERPLYAFQSPGLDDERDPHADIPSMAALYVDELLAARPVGPYHLCGYSMGGVVAFEMARQLQARGAQVGLLALLDAKAPDGDARRGAEDEASLLPAFARDLGLSPERFTLSAEDLAPLSPAERLEHILEEAERQGLVPPDIERRQVGRLWQVFKANVGAAHSYVPGPYRGRVTLFRVASNGADPNGGWGAFAEEVESSVLPGDHYSILREPHVGTLAELLASRVSGAEVDGRGVRVAHPDGPAAETLFRTEV